MAKDGLAVFEATVHPGVELPFGLRFNRDDDTFDLLEFTAVVRPKDATLEFAIASFVRYDKDGNPRLDMAAVMKFFRKVLTKGDDYERFAAVMEGDNDLTITTEQIQGVIELIVEKSAGFPTQASNGSSARRSTSGRPSMAKRA